MTLPNNSNQRYWLVVNQPHLTLPPPSFSLAVLPLAWQRDRAGNPFQCPRRSACQVQPRLSIQIPRDAAAINKKGLIRRKPEMLGRAPALAVQSIPADTFIRIQGPIPAR